MAWAMQASLDEELRNEALTSSKTVDVGDGAPCGPRLSHLPGSAPHRRARAPLYGARDQPPAHGVYRDRARPPRPPLDRVAGVGGRYDLTGRQSRPASGADPFPDDDHWLEGSAETQDRGG